MKTRYKISHCQKSFITGVPRCFKLLCSTKGFEFCLSTKFIIQCLRTLYLIYYILPPLIANQSIRNQYILFYTSRLLKWLIKNLSIVFQPHFLCGEHKTPFCLKRPNTFVSNRQVARQTGVVHLSSGRVKTEPCLTSFILPQVGANLSSKKQKTSRSVFKNARLSVVVYIQSRPESHPPHRDSEGWNTATRNTHRSPAPPLLYHP